MTDASEVSAPKSRVELVDDFLRRCEEQARTCEQLSRLERRLDRPIVANAIDHSARTWRAAAELARIMLVIR